MNNVNQLTDGTPWKWIARLSLPTLIGYLFNQLYSGVDGVIVGKEAIGVQSFAAIGAVTSLIK